MIPDGVELSRYIFNKKDIRTVNEKLVVLANAFLPNEGETSVFIIKDLDAAAIWGIGKNHVEAERKAAGSPNSLKGRADFLSTAANSQKLRIVPETSMHPLHANLVDWPPSESASLMIATNIAATAVVHKVL